MSIEAKYQIFIETDYFFVQISNRQALIPLLVMLILHVGATGTQDYHCKI